ncbi:MAG: hypothetical protein IKZ21_01940, partial [Clostridia bacterium]|nr:hypothetical protein [Clostridia bacterium]
MEKTEVFYIDNIPGREYNGKKQNSRLPQEGEKRTVENVVFNQNPPKWYQISSNIHVTSMDRVNVTEIHPDRILSEWVLVLVTSGERTFR